MSSSTPSRNKGILALEHGQLDTSDARSSLAGRNSSLEHGPQTCSSVVGECASSPDEPTSPHTRSTILEVPKGREPESMTFGRLTPPAEQHDVSCMPASDQGRDRVDAVLERGIRIGRPSCLPDGALRTYWVKAVPFFDAGRYLGAATYMTVICRATVRLT